MWMYDVDIYIHKKNHVELYDCKSYRCKHHIKDYVEHQFYEFENGYVEKTIECYEI